MIALKFHFEHKVRSCEVQAYDFIVIIFIVIIFLSLKNINTFYLLRFLMTAHTGFITNPFLST